MHNAAQKQYEKYAKLKEKSGRRLNDNIVAKEIGIPRASLDDWKHGRSMPNYEKMCKITKYFGVPADYFYSDD